MDTKQLLAAAPLLRKAWRVLPGPLRVPLLVVAFVVWLVRRGHERPEDDASTAA